MKLASLPHYQFATRNNPRINVYNLSFYYSTLIADTYKKDILCV